LIADSDCIAYLFASIDFPVCVYLECEAWLGFPLKDEGFVMKIRHAAFSLIELLVVIAIISILASLLLPALRVARARGWEVSCMNNMRQMFILLDIYADDHDGWYPLEPKELNPHRGLIDTLRIEEQGLYGIFYCPTSKHMEGVARELEMYPPKGIGTTIEDSPENRAEGNISYLYWSCMDRSPFRGTNHSKWGPEMDSFRPRHVRQYGDPKPYQPGDDQTPCAVQSERPGDYWLMSDFFRQGAPFPHTRSHKQGLNVLFRDGHSELVIGQPRACFK
jgi:prepilin-type N-terminal cleavage/methylation domain-containing protein